MTNEETTRINAMMAELQRQRDQAQLACGQMAGEIAVLKAENDELKRKAILAAAKQESNVVDLPQAG